MAQTVIGLFDNSSEAQNAVQKLLSSGFSNNDVDITTRSAASGTTATASSTDTDSDNDSFGDKVSHFFKSLFGDDDNDDYRRYSSAAGKSQSIVTVYVDSEDEAERAADILDDAGAADVDEKAGQYGSSSGSNYKGSSADSSYGTSGTSYPHNTGDLSTNLGSTATTGATGDISGYASSAGTAGTSDYNTGSDYNKGSDYKTSSDYATRSGDSDLSDTGKSLKVIEEELQVGKKEVQTGGARLRSRIIHKPVEEQVRLREETVRVERTPVDRPATEADFNSFKEGEIELTETAEVPVVSKEARVVEEVSLDKDVNERVETVKDTVRKTEVDVEKLDKDDVSNLGRRDI